MIAQEPRRKAVRLASESYVTRIGKATVAILAKREPAPTKAEGRVSSLQRGAMRCGGNVRRCIAFVATLALVLAVTPASAEDYLWKTVEVSGHNYEVHLVTTGPLQAGFPDRALSWGATDRDLLTDVYVVDQAIGSAVEVTRALQILSLVQSSFKTPANPSVLLDANESIPYGEIAWGTSSRVPLHRWAPVESFRSRTGPRIIYRSYPRFVCLQFATYRLPLRSFDRAKPAGPADSFRRYTSRWDPESRCRGEPVDDNHWNRC
jgi:hypothetical protein